MAKPGCSAAPAGGRAVHVTWALLPSCYPAHAGAPNSCKAGGSFTLASTAPGQQSALASPNEAFAMVLKASGALVIENRSTGAQQVLAGVTSSCRAPLRVVLRPSGQLVLEDSTGTVIWTSASACRGNTNCYRRAAHAGF